MWRTLRRQLRRPRPPISHRYGPTLSSFGDSPVAPTFETTEMVVFDRGDAPPNVRVRPDLVLPPGLASGRHRNVAELPIRIVSIHPWFVPPSRVVVANRRGLDQPARRVESKRHRSSSPAIRHRGACRVRVDSVPSDVLLQRGSREPLQFAEEPKEVTLIEATAGLVRHREE